MYMSQDHKLRTNLCQILWLESWISWFILNKNAWNIAIFYDSQIQNILNFKNYLKNHAYLIFWYRFYCQFLVLRLACIESSQWFVNACYCPLCWTCMELEWSLGLGADVGEPAGQFGHTGHAAQLVVEGALFLHAAGLGKDGRRCLCQGMGPSLRGLQQRREQSTIIQQQTGVTV